MHSIPPNRCRSALSLTLAALLGLGPSLAQAAPTASVAPTGNPYIDAVLFGTRWADPNLTYSFPTSPTHYTTTGTGEQNAGFDYLQTNQQVATRNVLKGYTFGTALRFTEMSESDSVHGTLRFAESSSPRTAWGYYPNTHESGGDMWFNNAMYANPLRGNYEWLTFVHELGHAIGGKHTHEATPGFNTMPPQSDSTEYSVMSYRSYIGGSTTTGYTNGGCNYPQTPMMYDIAAHQHQYGPNFAHNATDTVYQWSTSTGEMIINGVGQGVPCANRIFLTIWDGGGTDLLHLTNYTTNLKINLRPGAWSTLSTTQIALLNGAAYPAAGNIAMSQLYRSDPASLIENVNGGSGSDTIIGNAANNRFVGSGGNDVLDGDLGINTAAYAHNRAEYRVTKNADGSWQVTDLRAGSPEGTDTLRNIQYLTFGDGTVAIESTQVVNRAPVAVGDAYGTDQNVALSIAPAVGLLTNDSDPDGDRLTAILVTNPLHGTLELRPDGSFTYNPSAGYAGSDSFVYRVSDGKLQSASVIVSLTVQGVAVPHNPTAGNDSYSVNAGITLTVNAPGVLANDADVDADTLTTVRVNTAYPQNGTLTLNLNGSFTYTPRAGFSGQDVFYYQATDGVLNSPTATVTINVIPAATNQPPTAQNDAYTTRLNFALHTAAPGVLRNDSDPEGAPLQAVLVQGTARGTITLRPDGSFVYNPRRNVGGQDRFTYQATDGQGKSTITTVNINVVR